MFAGPPFTQCPAGAWTTIFRGPVLPIGVISIEEKLPVAGGGAQFDYRVASVMPPYYYTGNCGPCGLPTGGTPWAELTVKPKRTCYLRATGF